MSLSNLTLVALSAVAFAGCAAATQSSMPAGSREALRHDAAAVAATSSSRDLASAHPSDTLPSELVGVWSDGSADGRAQCARYRTLPADMSESDEGWISLVGSLVVEPHMIHAVSEYGEGNFYAVKDIKRIAAGLWQVQVQTGIDALPFDDVGLETEAYRLQLQHGRLSWEPLLSKQERPSSYFRCGDLRRGVYSVE